MKFNHILITSDLSDEALRPFAPVLDLAREMDARVTLLHVVYDLMVAPHGAALAPPVSSMCVNLELDGARKSLQEQRELIGTDLDVEVKVIAGTDIAQSVADYAKQNHVDVIALSTHGRTGWKHMLLGSVAEAILRRSEVPVLSFPRQK